jgi:acetyltransferase-like isoleucine patch superfamily enzyme
MTHSEKRLSRLARTSPLVGKLASFSRVIAKIRNKIAFPGSAIHPSVNLNVDGGLAYGARCILNEGSNLVIPQGASLILGDDCYIGRYTEICPAPTIRIGAQTSIQDRCILLGDITIGRYCVFATGVYLSSGRHYYDLAPHLNIRDQDAMVRNTKALADQHNRPVTIEDDCWLGMNTVVMSGVTIGKGAIVGANSVVTRDVAPYTVVAGAPAKAIRNRLDFQPPRSIHYDRPEDWPYFYNGCAISQDERELYVADSGIAVLENFTLALDASDGQEIHLLMRNLRSQPCQLIYAGQEQLMGHQWQEIIFKLEANAGDRHPFSLKFEMDLPEVIIQKAWIQ